MISRSRMILLAFGPLALAACGGQTRIAPTQQQATTQDVDTGSSSGDSDTWPDDDDTVPPSDDDSPAPSIGGGIIVIDPGHHHHKPWPPVIVDPVHPKPIHPPIVTGTFPIDPVSDPGIKPVHGFPVGGIKPIKGYPVSSGGSNNNSCFADPAKCLNLHPKFQH